MTTRGGKMRLQAYGQAHFRTRCLSPTPTASVVPSDHERRPLLLAVHQATRRTPSAVSGTDRAVSCLMTCATAAFTRALLPVVAVIVPRANRTTETPIKAQPATEAEEEGAQHTAERASESETQSETNSECETQSETQSETENERENANVVHECESESESVLVSEARVVLPVVGGGSRDVSSNQDGQATTDATASFPASETSRVSEMDHGSENDAEIEAGFLHALLLDVEERAAPMSSLVSSTELRHASRRSWTTMARPTLPATPLEDSHTHAAKRSRGCRHSSSRYSSTRYCWNTRSRPRTVSLQTPEVAPSVWNDAYRRSSKTTMRCIAAWTRTASWRVARSWSGTCRGSR